MVSTTNVWSAQSSAINDYVGQWQTNLQTYITTPHPIHEELKVTATLNSDGQIDPGSVQVFELADELGDGAP